VIELQYSNRQTAWSQRVYEPQMKEHVNATISKAATSLHFLKQLKRELVCCTSALQHPLREYCMSIVRHSALSAAQSDAL